jgi:hypothetical protein
MLPTRGRRTDTGDCPGTSHTHPLWRQEAVTVVANDVQRRRARRRGDIDIRELRGPRRLLVVKLFELVDELLWVSRVCAAYTQSEDL